MFYLENDLDDYKYVVDYSDNYLVLSKTRRVVGSYQEPDEIECLVQYLSPSTLNFKTNRVFYNTQTFATLDVSNDIYDRADFTNILFCAVVIVVLTLFIYNILSKIFVRGGILR